MAHRVVWVGGFARCRWLGAGSLKDGAIAGSDGSRVVGAGSHARRGWLGAGSLMVCGSACSDCSWVVVIGIHARCRWLLRGSLVVGVTGSLCVAPAGLLMVRVRIRFGSCAHDFNDSHR